MHIFSKSDNSIFFHSINFGKNVLMFNLLLTFPSLIEHIGVFKSLSNTYDGVFCENI